MNMTKVRIRLAGAALLVWALLVQAAWAQSGPSIVVLPFYTEKGDVFDAGGYEGRRYRRLSGYINNQLVRHGFDVIDPTAKTFTLQEYNRLRGRPGSMSPLAAVELTRRFEVSMVYLVWVDVIRDKKSIHNFCIVLARVAGEGYDSSGRSLGARLDRDFTDTVHLGTKTKTCEDAIIEVEKQAGDEIGRILTASSHSGSGETGTRIALNPLVSPGGGNGGVIVRGGDKQAQRLVVRLEGTTDHELIEIFGKAIHATRGFSDIRDHFLNIVPGNNRASYASWTVGIQGTNGTLFSANIMKVLDDVYRAGGQIEIANVPFRYEPVQVDLIKGIRPFTANPGSIMFILDMERVRAKEFAFQ